VPRATNKQRFLFCSNTFGFTKNISPTPKIHQLLCGIFHLRKSQRKSFQQHLFNQIYIAEELYEFLLNNK